MNIVNRHLSIIALALSLLLHLFLSIYFTTKKQHFTPQNPKDSTEKTEQILPKEQKNEKDIEWVETHSRNSFGAPVLFKDEPDDEINAEQPSTDDAQPSTEQAEESLKKSIDIPEKIAQIDSQKPATITTNKANSSSEVEKNDHQGNIIPQSTRVPSIRASAPLVMPKRPSLAQLTRGVLNYANKEGSSAVSMLGKKNGVPTDEQIRYERYTQKLNWCLHNSCTINREKHPRTQPLRDNLLITLTLNRNGSVKKVELISSCGDARIDSFYLTSFNDANGSFPPVPHYLQADPFIINYLISLHADYSQPKISYKRSTKPVF
jgi:outer membrane biosynthesis protein TonB